MSIFDMILMRDRIGASRRRGHGPDAAGLRSVDTLDRGMPPRVAVS
jgi:hypothetical protein